MTRRPIPPERIRLGQSPGHKKAKPIVIDRYQFKEDVTGYLGKSRDHLYLLDVTTHATRILTPGMFDEEVPAWSPDGRRIAFVSKRSPGDVDRANNWDVFVTDTQPGAAAKQLTTWSGADNPPESGRLAWSPDGASIAYVRGSADPRLFAYDQFQLAVIERIGRRRACTDGSARSRRVRSPMVG